MSNFNVNIVSDTQNTENGIVVPVSVENVPEIKITTNNYVPNVYLTLKKVVNILLQFLRKIYG